MKNHKDPYNPEYLKECEKCKKQAKLITPRLCEDCYVETNLYWWIHVPRRAKVNI